MEANTVPKDLKCRPAVLEAFERMIADPSKLAEHQREAIGAAALAVEHDTGSSSPVEDFIVMALHFYAVGGQHAQPRAMKGLVEGFGRDFNIAIQTTQSLRRVYGEQVFDLQPVEVEEE